MAEKTQLTSVKILTGLYKDFKVSTINDGITLQKLVNRSINLYLNNVEYRTIITNYKELADASGSQF